MLNISKVCIQNWASEQQWLDSKLNWLVQELLTQETLTKEQTEITLQNRPPILPGWWISETSQKACKYTLQKLATKHVIIFFRVNPPTNLFMGLSSREVPVIASRKACYYLGPRRAWPVSCHHKKNGCCKQIICPYKYMVHNI